MLSELLKNVTETGLVKYNNSKTLNSSATFYAILMDQYSDYATDFADDKAVLFERTFRIECQAPQSNFAGIKSFIDSCEETLVGAGYAPNVVGPYANSGEEGGWHAYITGVYPHG